MKLPLLLLCMIALTLVLWLLGVVSGTIALWVMAGGVGILFVLDGKKAR